MSSESESDHDHNPSESDSDEPQSKIGNRPQVSARPTAKPRGRTEYSVEAKIEAVDRLENDFNGNLHEASRHMDIDRHRLRSWRREKEKLMETKKMQDENGEKPAESRYMEFSENESDGSESELASTRGKFRAFYTVEAKLEAVDRLEKNFDGNLHRAARKMKVDRKRLRAWREEKEKGTLTSRSGSEDGKGGRPASEPRTSTRSQQPTQEDSAAMQAMPSESEPQAKKRRHGSGGASDGEPNTESKSTNERSTSNTPVSSTELPPSPTLQPDSVPRDQDDPDSLPQDATNENFKDLEVSDSSTLKHECLPIGKEVVFYSRFRRAHGRARGRPRKTPKIERSESPAEIAEIDGDPDTTIVPRKSPGRPRPRKTPKDSPGLSAERKMNEISETESTDSEFKVDETVLCAWLGSWYHAKVMRVEERAGIPMYEVHYVGWNKRYDEVVARKKLQKASPELLRLVKKLGSIPVAEVEVLKKVAPTIPRNYATRPQVVRVPRKRKAESGDDLTIPFLCKTCIEPLDPYGMCRVCGPPSADHPCPLCGVELLNAAGVCRSCGPNQTACGVMRVFYKCQSCNEPIEAGAASCSKCGALAKSTRGKGKAGAFRGKQKSGPSRAALKPSAPTAPPRQPRPVDGTTQEKPWPLNSLSMRYVQCTYCFERTSGSYTHCQNCGKLKPAEKQKLRNMGDTTKSCPLCGDSSDTGMCTKCGLPQHEAQQVANDLDTGAILDSCDSCLAPLPKAFDRCRKCGTANPSYDQRIRKGKEIVRWQKCSACSAKFSESAEVCPGCGLQSQNTAQPNKIEAPDTEPSVREQDVCEKSPKSSSDPRGRDALPLVDQLFFFPEKVNVSKRPDFAHRRAECNFCPQCGLNFHANQTVCGRCGEPRLRILLGPDGRRRITSTSKSGSARPPESAEPGSPKEPPVGLNAGAGAAADAVAKGSWDVCFDCGTAYHSATSCPTCGSTGADSLNIVPDYNESGREQPDVDAPGPSGVSAGYGSAATDSDVEILVEMKVTGGVEVDADTEPMVVEKMEFDDSIALGIERVVDSCDSDSPIPALPNVTPEGNTSPRITPDFDVLPAITMESDTEDETVLLASPERNQEANPDPESAIPSLMEPAEEPENDDIRITGVFMNSAASGGSSVHEKPAGRTTTYQTGVDLMCSWKGVHYPARCSAVKFNSTKGYYMYYVRFRESERGKHVDRWVTSDKLFSLDSNLESPFTRPRPKIKVGDNVRCSDWDGREYAARCAAVAIEPGGTYKYRVVFDTKDWDTVETWFTADKVTLVYPDPDPEGQVQNIKENPENVEVRATRSRSKSGPVGSAENSALNTHPVVLQPDLPASKFKVSGTVGSAESSALYPRPVILRPKFKVGDDVLYSEPDGDVRPARCMAVRRSVNGHVYRITYRAKDRKRRAPGPPVHVWVTAEQLSPAYPGMESPERKGKSQGHKYIHPSEPSLPKQGRGMRIHPSDVQYEPQSQPDPQRPHMCAGCSKTFKRAYNLSQHLTMCSALLDSVTFDDFDEPSASASPSPEASYSQDTPLGREVIGEVMVDQLEYDDEAGPTGHSFVPSAPADPSSRRDLEFGLGGPVSMAKSKGMKGMKEKLFPPGLMRKPRKPTAKAAKMEKYLEDVLASCDT